ncbi:MAG TPA: hypothetical protein VLF59_01560 [Candidatus Saccharimonadales bacterium]|nr:hypothetical protein [Candidatus Saccharimonadales bacterium]
MSFRFPELTIQNPSNPSDQDIETGLWCAPGFEPDESAVTVLPSDQSATERFASISPKHLWLENGSQTIVALTSPHTNDPAHALYAELSAMFPQFVQATENRNRAVLYEGKIRLPHVFSADAETVARENGEMVYLQKLAHAADIQAHSTEPPGDAELRTIQLHWPTLRQATGVYTIARMIPHAHRRVPKSWTEAEIAELREACDFWPDPEAAVRSSLAADLEPLPAYIFRYLSARSGEMTPGEYHALYSPDPIRGRASIAGAANHLKAAHGITATTEDLCCDPSPEAIDQLFRCTNSPVFTEPDLETKDLCDLQRVSVLVNRLRDRRITTQLATLALHGESFFWMSGLLHFDMSMCALTRIAEERHLKRAAHYTAASSTA